MPKETHLTTFLMLLLDSATLEIRIYLTQVLRGNTVTLKLWWET